MRSFLSNKQMYLFANTFICILCASYIYTGYYYVRQDIHDEKASLIAQNDTEPLSEKAETSKKIVTTIKSNTSSKTYVKPSYDALTGSYVVEYAKNYLGLRYVNGGNSLTTGTDCSGFTKLIYAEFGINLPRSVSGQKNSGSYVSKSDLQKGDLIFYGKTEGVASHVAIYIGDGKVIHQSTPKSGVKINTMNMMVYITARRIITKRSQVLIKDDTNELDNNALDNNNLDSINELENNELSSVDDENNETINDDTLNNDTVLDNNVIDIYTKNEYGTSN